MSVPHPILPESAPAPRRHLLTIAVEDYFQVIALSKVIQQSQWYRFEQRVERNTRKALDLLDEYSVKATFFVVGWVAEEMPEVVREIADRGHEVATKGYYHRSIDQMTPGEFREDLLRSKEVIEAASGVRVQGHRVARGRLGLDDTWALDVLAEEGFAYDSSFYPYLRSISAEPWRRTAHRHGHGERMIWELPLSTYKIGGLLLPLAGGNYFRQLPHRLVDHAFNEWERTTDSPFVMYFHVWELDPDLPEITAAGPVARLRQYRHLDRMASLVRYRLEHSRFTSIADHLGLEAEPAQPRVRLAGPVPVPIETPKPEERTPVTLVIPCFNEERVLRYLANTLESVYDNLGSLFEIRVVFVDDGSSDATWQQLLETFGDWPDVRFVRHDRNRGVAAAILTGIREADTEVVCSIDCDCTYDPLQIRELIPMLVGDVTVVTASPYHVSGRVHNVPWWRLFLSKSLSAMYRLVLRQRLATYTSCFRAYRRSEVADLEVSESGFLGVTEMLCLLDLDNKKIAECPAVLEVRMLGRSKMKLLSVITGHLGLLARIARLRIAGGRPAARTGTDADLQRKEEELRDH